MSEELKPCPFCGKKASIQDCSYYGSAPAWSAMCDNPTCFAYTEAFKTKKEAIERWNNRPAEEALQKRIAELEAERDRLREALKEVLNCEVVTDTGDYSKGGTGFDCNEVKEIIRGALAE